MKQIGLLTIDNEFEYIFRTAISNLGYIELSIYREIDAISGEFLLDLLVIDCDATIEDELECRIKQLKSVTSKIILFSDDYNIQQFTKMRSISPIGYLEKIANPLQIIQAVDLALWKKSKPSSEEQPDYYLNEIQEKLFVKVGSAYKTLLIQ
jgi:DNA-binding NarL/FixJ family response regulator